LPIQGGMQKVPSSGVKQSEEGGDATPAATQGTAPADDDGGVRRFATGGPISEDARARLAAARHGASDPPPAALRAQVEASLGAELADVRVHTGAAAADAAKALAAHAFAHGRDIYFGAGQYAPDRADGQRLIAHEIAHTVQTGPASGDPLVSEPGGAVER